MKLNLSQIKREMSLSPRDGTDKETAEDYAQCFDQLPLIVVFKVPDQEKYLLVDGWHRYRAAEILELKEIEVEARTGSYEDAKEFALLANLKHGKPLTRKEKRHVIAEFLKLHPERANNWIAGDLGTTDKTVKTIRLNLEADEGLEFPNLTTLTGKDGSKYPRITKIPDLKPATKDEDNTEIEDAPIEEVLQPEPDPIPALGPYQLNKAHQVDCVEGLFNLPEGSIDLIFADPPYNIGVKYGQGHNDKLPSDDYHTWCSQWFMGCYRTLKPGGSLYLMHYPEVAARWMQLLSMFTFRRWITWVYNSNIGHSGSNWSRSHRTILYYTKGSVPSFFNGEADPQPYKNPDDKRIKHLGKDGTTPYDWWEYDLVKNISKDKTSWPNQIPVDLVRRIVASSCPNEGIVCDPFMGSGTTAVASVKTQKQWVGFDKQKKSCDTTMGRVINERQI